MSLAKAEAKINNIDRVVTYGKKDKLELVDRATREVLAKVKLWSWKKLNPAQQGAPTYLFRLAADSTTSPILSSCDIAFNGVVHDVVVRSEPESISGIEWTLRTRPTLEVTDA